MDIQHGMIKRLKARAARTGVSNLVAIVGDAAEVDFAQAYFDVVYLCTTLGEIPDRAAVLAQCHTALKADGVLSITEIFPDPHFQSRSSVIRLAEETGFTLKNMAGQWYFFTANFVKKKSRLE